MSVAYVNNTTQTFVDDCSLCEFPRVRCIVRLEFNILILLVLPTIMDFQNLSVALKTDLAFRSLVSTFISVPPVETVVLITLPRYVNSTRLHQ